MADTASVESAQALFCSLADYVLSKNDNVDAIFDADRYSSYDMFNQYWKELYPNKTIKSIYDNHTDTGRTAFAKIESYLEDNVDWFKSSVLIARKLVKDIDKVVRGFKGIKKPKVSEIWFVRGDDTVMKNIESLFNLANETRKQFNSIPDNKNKQIVFSDINRWSPADIYFATDKARKNISDTLTKKPKGYTFTELNILISDLIQSGDLLPLSLKKSTRDVILKPVNFIREQEVEEISNYSFYGIKPWKPWKVELPQTRGLEIYISQDKKWNIGIRHDPSTNAFKAEIKKTGAEARFGSMSEPESFKALLNILDPSFASSYYKLLIKSSENFLSGRKALGKKPTDKKLKEAYDTLRVRVSALEVTNKNLPPLIKWLNADEKRAENFVRLFYEFCTSRTVDSAKFVIAKGY